MWLYQCENPRTFNFIETESRQWDRNVLSIGAKVSVMVTGVQYECTGCRRTASLKMARGGPESKYFVFLSFRKFLVLHILIQHPGGKSRQLSEFEASLLFIAYTQPVTATQWGLSQTNKDSCSQYMLFPWLSSSLPFLALLSLWKMLSISTSWKKKFFFFEISSLYVTQVALKLTILPQPPSIKWQILYMYFFFFSLKPNL